MFLHRRRSPERHANLRFLSDSRTHFLALEHVGYSRRNVIGCAGYLRDVDAVGVLNSVLNGFKYLNEHKIVFHDTKSENVLCKLTLPPYFVPICTFGLYNFSDALFNAPPSSPAILRKRTGELVKILGKLPYVTPYSSYFSKDYTDP